MSAEVIQSYLVLLGFETDQPSINKFQDALGHASSVVTANVSGILGEFLKFQVGVTGAFTAVGFGIIGYIDKLAMADQQQRLFAMRNFMTIQQSRSVEVALKTLGASMEDVAWDKELHARFSTLIQDQRELSAMLGPQYEKQMHDVRDVWFQLQRLEVKGEYFGMKFVSDLLQKMGLGDGDILHSLMRLNDFVMQNMPQWADELSTDIVPILKDFWMILTDIGHLAGDVALEFTNLVGVFTGDTSLEGATFDFHKFASAVEKVAHGLAVVVHYMVEAERLAVRFAPVLALGGIGAVVGGPEGAAIGGGLGLGVTAIEEAMRYGSAGGAGGGTGGQGARTSGGGGNMADKARQMAKTVSGSTGIPADLIYAQWAHETGNFTNRGARELNNLAGIRIPGTTTYRSFGSPDEFAAYFTHLLESKRYAGRGINDARTPEQYAHILKAGSYYEGKESEYVAGMHRFQPQYAGGGGGRSISIGSIPITVAHTNASPNEIASAVQQGVRLGLAEHDQRNMTELAGAYQ
jgi:hypothetical protein